MRTRTKTAYWKTKNAKPVEMPKGYQHFIAGFSSPDPVKREYHFRRFTEIVRW